MFLAENEHEASPMLATVPKMVLKLPIISPISISNPTVTKNRPSSTPRNGAMSASI